MVLGIVKAFLKILGIGIGVKKVVLFMSATHLSVRQAPPWSTGKCSLGRVTFSPWLGLGGRELCG